MSRLRLSGSGISTFSSLAGAAGKAFKNFEGTQYNVITMLHDSLQW